MAQKLYRVVETVWKANGRESVDVGCEWKPERAARAEMKALARSNRGSSIPCNHRSSREKHMNRFTYRAYYHYNGPSRADPFRSEKSAREVAEALQRFPVELEHFLSDGSKIEIPQDLNGSGSSYVTVVSLAEKSQVDEAVKNCLISLDLFGEKLPPRS